MNGLWNCRDLEFAGTFSLFQICSSLSSMFRATHALWRNQGNHCRYTFVESVYLIQVGIDTVYFSKSPPPLFALLLCESFVLYADEDIIWVRHTFCVILSTFLSPEIPYFDRHSTQCEADVSERIYNVIQKMSSVQTWTSFNLISTDCPCHSTENICRTCIL